MVNHVYYGGGVSVLETNVGAYGARACSEKGVRSTSCAAITTDRWRSARPHMRAAFMCRSKVGFKPVRPIRPDV